jgi:hypothetical protein
MPKPRKYPDNPTQSHPEVFIIESLAMDEERKGAFEGRALYESLKTLGKQPLYHYVRSADELRQALSLFRHSKYNFLHFSLHGSPTSVFTTLDELSNQEFAEITSKKLPNRRVTFSACSLGSGSLVQDIQRQNKGVESIAAPLGEIEMHMAMPFWLAFYCRALHENGLNFSAQKLSSLLQPLCSYFSIRLNWSYWLPLPAPACWKAFLIK